MHIDKAGRIVVPKPVRDRHGLRPGSSIEILESPEGIVIRRAKRKPSLVREGNLLVHTGRLPQGYDMREAVQEEREEHIREIWSR